MASIMYVGLGMISLISRLRSICTSTIVDFYKKNDLKIRVEHSEETEMWSYLSPFGVRVSVYDTELIPSCLKRRS